MEVMRKSTRIFSWIAVCSATLVFVAAGCTKLGSNTGLNGTVTYISVIHAAPYTGTVSVYLNDTVISQQGGIATGAYSHIYGKIRPGNFVTRIEDAITDSVLDQLPASEYDTLNFYTLILYNSSANGATQALKIHDDFSGVSSNYTYYRFWNLAPDFPNINLYFNTTLIQGSRTTGDNAINNSLNSFTAMAAGSYVLSARDALTDSLIATTGNITLTNGNAFTIWLTGQRGSSSKPMTINVLQAAY